MEKQKRYRSLLKKLRYVWHSRKRNFLKMAFTIRMKKTKKFYMYKRKAWVPKFWFNKKFRWRGRSDHKLKIWLSREYKIYIKKDLLKSIPARGTTSGHLLRDKRFKSGTEGYGRYAAIANLKKGSTTKIYRRRKIKLDSKLSKFIYKTSRFCSPNSYKNFGKEVLTKYNTIPFKLSMSRFIANKIFRSFYKHLSKKVLLGIQKKVKNKKNSFKNHMSFGVGSIKKLKKVFIQPLNKNINDLGIVSEKIKNYTNLRQKYEKTNLIRIKKKLLQKCEGEKSKRMVTLIEQRLDSTVLRLLHFKPVYSKYTLTRRNKNLKFHLSPLGLKNAKDTSKVSDSQEKKKVLVRAGGPVTSVTKSSQKTGTYAVPGAPRPALPLNEIAPSLRIAQEWTNNNYSFLQKLQDRNTSTLKSSKKVYVRKNPLVSYTPLQIKQMINHGHISVNGQKVKSGNFQIKSLDKISIKGFIQNLNLFRPSVVLDCTENKESQETNQRYKLLSKVAKMSQTFFKKKSLKKSSLWPSESSELYLKKGTLKKESASSAARSKTIVSKNTEVKNVKELASFPRKDAGPKGLLKTSLTRLGEKEVLNFPVGLISFKKKDLEHKIFCASDLKQDVKTTKKIRRGISLGDTYFNSESIAPYTKISQGKLLRNLNKLPQSTFGLEPVARCRWTPNFEKKKFRRENLISNGGGNHRPTEKRRSTLQFSEKDRARSPVTSVTKAKNFLTLQQNYKKTFLLRRLKDQNFLETCFTPNLTSDKEGSAKEADITNVDGRATHPIQISNFIKDLKLKRFTEAFYITYRNLYLLQRLPFEVNLKTKEEKESDAAGLGHNKNKALSGGPSSKKTDNLSLGQIKNFKEASNLSTDIIMDTFLKPKVEEDLEILFNSIGLNQSIYHLWPLSSLLKIRKNSWNPTLKKALSKQTFKKYRGNKKRLLNDLKWCRKRKINTRRFKNFIIFYLQERFKMDDFTSKKDTKLKSKIGLSTKSKINERASQGEKILNKCSIPEQIIRLSKENPKWLTNTISRRIYFYHKNFGSYSQTKNMERMKMIKESIEQKNNPLNWRNTKNNEKQAELLILGKPFKSQNFMEPLCYASLVYNTNLSYVIRSQQFNRNSQTSYFYNRIFKGGRTSQKLNFFELELQFIQLVYDFY